MTCHNDQLYLEGYEDGYQDCGMLLHARRALSEDPLEPYTRGYHDGLHMRVLEKRKEAFESHLRRSMNTLHTRTRNG